MAKSKKKVRRIKDPDIDEVSFVDDPANLTRFLFFKSADGETIELDKAKKPSIKIKSDGTIKGTSMTINGAEIANVVEMNLSYFKTPDMAADSSVSMSYTTANKTAAGGFVALKRFTLAKALEESRKTNPITKNTKDFKAATDKQLEVIRKFVDKGASLDGIDETAGAALAEPLGVLADYQKLLPPEADIQLRKLVAAAAVGLRKGEDEMADEDTKEKTDEEVKAEEEKAKAEADKKAKEDADKKKVAEEESAKRVADQALGIVRDALGGGEKDDGKLKPLAEGQEPTREATNALIESNNALRDQVAALAETAKKREDEDDGKDGEDANDKTPAGEDLKTAEDDKDDDEEVEMDTEALAQAQHAAEAEALAENG